MNVSPRLRAPALLPFLSAACFASSACDSTTPEKEPSSKTQAASSASADKSNATKAASAEALMAAQKRKQAAREALQKAREPQPVAARPVNKVAPTPGDPEKGDFTLAEATKGLPGEGKLSAEIVTAEGTLVCEMYEDKAPISVANFVGLARGLRPWNKAGKWVKEPLYNGTKFHRVIRGFMIQGGDPAGNGSGGPGYVIPDEIWANAHHDTVGQLCMANRGPDTNGSQFFIMDGAASHLDGGYTIFGQCTPESVVRALSSAEVQGDRATKPPLIKSVTVKREPKGTAAAVSAAPSPAAAPTSK